jgi:hypothetical protein
MSFSNLVNVRLSLDGGAGIRKIAGLRLALGRGMG